MGRVNMRYLWVLERQEWHYGWVSTFLTYSTREAARKECKEYRSRSAMYRWRVVKYVPEGK